MEEKHITTRTSKTTTVESGFDTGSDSESEIIEKTYKSPINNHDYRRSKCDFVEVMYFFSLFLIFFQICRLRVHRSLLRLRMWKRLGNILHPGWGKT